MLVNLFGIKEVNYTSKRTGNPVSGTELHIVYHDDRVKYNKIYPKKKKDD